MGRPDDGDPDDQQGGSQADGRSRRTRAGRANKAASAFEKLRKAKEKGEKYKYQVEEEKDIYEVVDEEEYSELVKQRQEDDWIVDDDGAGYVEDGREIFDEELENDQFNNKKEKKGEKKKKNKNIVPPGTKPKQDIKSMFAAAAIGNKHKKLEKAVTLANDELLGDLMEELQQKPAKSGSSTPKTAPTPKFANPFKVDRVPQPSASPLLAMKTVKTEPGLAPARATKSATATETRTSKTMQAAEPRSSKTARVTEPKPPAKKTSSTPLLGPLPPSMPSLPLLSS